MTIGNYNLIQLWHQINRYHNQINMFLVVLLSLYLISFAADLTWRLLEKPVHTAPTASQQVTTATRANANTQVSLQKVKQLFLFGNPAKQPKKAEPVVADAPQTNLNLTLTGVVTSSNDGEGTAIIENRGSQNTYSLGDKIDGTNVVITQVMVDRIIIKNGSRNETLMLDGIDFNKQRNRPVANRPKRTAKTTGPQRQSMQRRTLSDKAVRATQKLRQKPTNFTDFIAISPVRESGELKGYRVSPGKDSSLFKSAGLKANDIVTEINGLDLTDIQQSMEAMGAMREAQSLQLTVNRDNNVLTLYLDLPSENTEL